MHIHVQFIFINTGERLINNLYTVKAQRYCNSNTVIGFGLLRIENLVY